MIKCIYKVNTLATLDSDKNQITIEYSQEIGIKAVYDVELDPCNNQYFLDLVSCEAHDDEGDNVDLTIADMEELHDFAKETCEDNGFLTSFRFYTDGSYMQP
jgi:hypothetical protein